MKVVSFILPDDFVLPVTLENLSPDVLASVFNCIAYLINNICLQDSTQEEQLQIAYEQMKKKLCDDTNSTQEKLKIEYEQMKKNE